MRSITHCPACQTEFFVTEEQLNKHHGQVRCGQCLHVFDAKEQIVELDTQSESNLASPVDATADEPLITDGVLVTDDVLNDVPAPIEITEPTEPTSSKISNWALIADRLPSNFYDLAGKSKLNLYNATKKSRPWLLLALFLLLIAIAQSIYFLRNEIAIYYPLTKPYLVQACKKIACSIDLPKKIEFIAIDDSDIQEDANYTGLVRLSSTLINQAGFNQAYPNIELTLTDVEDNPKLRRIFKPSEYLTDKANIANGLRPGEEVKINLAMTTQGVTVAGYRVFVTY
ncbi:MAG: DUF3426 domain-containing protein [Methylotenera sp.]